ncbi:hypothetical protein LZG00_11505 [Rhodobacteraceae bacterium LMO-12]|nr:hypothetical protein [Rhodobacteraceae bacterium LMO-JJ12]
MIEARVSGKIWASRRIGNLPSGALLEVATATGGRMIAFDPLGCAEGEAVLVVQGSVAAGYFSDAGATVDALIIASIDEDSAHK